MTREQIKFAIIEKATRLQEKGKDFEYIQGIIAGMASAFKMAGLLDDTLELLEEIYDEI